jgi:hypothetical protein
MRYLQPDVRINPEDCKETAKDHPKWKQ